MNPGSIEQRVTFGPFRMEHLRQQVDEAFQRAFHAYLAEKIFPSLEGRVVRIEGRVWSHYDQPQFVDLAEGKSRFYYEIACHSADGIEEAWGELDYDAVTARWVPSQVKPPHVRTLADKRRHQALMESHLYVPDRPSSCPQCNSSQVAEIVYGIGHWSPEHQAELDAGRKCEGGPWAWEQSSQWRCLSCRHEWGLTGFILALRALEERAKRVD